VSDHPSEAVISLTTVKAYYIAVQPVNDQPTVSAFANRFMLPLGQTAVIYSEPFDDIHELDDSVADCHVVVSAVDGVIELKHVSDINFVLGSANNQPTVAANGTYSAVQAAMSEIVFHPDSAKMVGVLTTVVVRFFDHGFNGYVHAPLSGEAEVHSMFFVPMALLCEQTQFHKLPYSVAFVSLLR
jgi:hypothetical protein